jgi:hypothetical protein
LRSTKVIDKTKNLEKPSTANQPNSEEMILASAKNLMVLGTA